MRSRAAASGSRYQASVGRPMSGGSFLLGGTNYLIDEIWTYEYIEPRFVLRGSDGSA